MAHGVEDILRDVPLGHLASNLRPCGGMELAQENAADRPLLAAALVIFHIHIHRKQLNLQSKYNGATNTLHFLF